MFNTDCLCSTCQVCQMTKKEQQRKKYGLIPPKITVSDIVSLGYGLCASVGCIYNKDTSQNTISTCSYHDRSSDTSQVCLELSKLQISQQHPFRICFITLGWQITRDLKFIVSNNKGGFQREFQKCMRKTIMALKPKELQVTTNHPTNHKQMQSLSEYTKFSMT
jgi:hypothetical protein